jgi:hypothetical protein
MSPLRVNESVVRHPGPLPASIRVLFYFHFHFPLFLGLHRTRTRVLSRHSIPDEMTAFHTGAALQVGRGANKKSLQE